MAANRKSGFYGQRETDQCDGCRRDYPESLLCPIGQGYLQVCPKCLPEALATVRTSSTASSAKTA